MKRIFVLLLVFIILLLPLSVLGQENDNVKDKEENIKTEEPENNKQSASNFKWEDMNEMQIALTMINRHIEYLMEQIENNEKRVSEILKGYEERHEKELQQKEEEIKNLQQKLAQKEAELEEARKEIMHLNKMSSIFDSKNGVYLKILLGFIVGLLAGMIINSVLSIINKKKHSS